MQKLIKDTMANQQRDWGSAEALRKRNPFVAASAKREKAEGALFKKQIHRADLAAEKLLGAGQFGEVYLAFQKVKDKASGAVTEERRAVKMLKGEADKKAKEEFMRECNMMLDIGEHPNVVQMVGVAVQQVPWLCVLEFQPYGDLREVVRYVVAQYVCLSFGLPVCLFFLLRQWLYTSFER